MAEITVTRENFEEEVLKSDIPVLLDFWATWCGPCRMVGPVVSQIAEENEGKIKVGKVNCDEQPELSSMFGVTSIPMLVMMRGGKASAATVGYQPKESLEKALGIK